MRKDLFGKTLSLSLGFLMCLSRTTAFNSTAKCLGDTVVSWGLRIGILLLPIPNIGQVEAVNKVIVNGLKKRLDDANGWKNYHMCSGRIELCLVGQLKIPHFR